jgi:hypothetical protein
MDLSSEAHTRKVALGVGGAACGGSCGRGGCVWRGVLPHQIDRVLPAFGIGECGVGARQLAI